eukprot:201910_1
MSKPQENQPKVEVVEDSDDDVPALEQADTTDVADTMPQRGAGKQGKKYAKAMQKLGLKPEGGISRVMIRRKDTTGMNFVINGPEVYRFPASNTFVIFGETQIDDATADTQAQAARLVAGAGAQTAEPAAAAPAEEEEDENAAPEDQGDLQDKEIDIVVAQASVSRNKAIRALKANKGDIVNAIMELTMA